MKKRSLLLPGLFAAALLLLVSCENGPSVQSSGVPLDPESPWPKFRANPEQNGLVAVKPVPNGMMPWEFGTSKGIFSSPVIDGDGNIYIGSADHFFYSLDRYGNLRWKFPTGEIIDSSALLDDKQRVYFGSGDQHVYCLNRNDGSLLWKFRAHSPEEVEEEFGIETFNLAWFEGNIAMLPGGDILAPNDNYLVYRIDRENGRLVDIFPGNEMIWSSPAVNEDTGSIFFGSNYNVMKNVFSYDASTGEKRWSRGGLGTNAASVLLTKIGQGRRDIAVVGGYDGFVRAYAQKNGRRIWKFGARDHIYSSPAQLSDGKIIQASADGTVYALDPGTGRPVWAFDSLEPIRSSPAVDSEDNIYFGSGSGRLFCLDRNGGLLWTYECVADGRNDLNSSPALGPYGIVIAGENGGVFFVPYDYPLTETGRTQVSSSAGGGESLPEKGAYLLYTDPFGSVKNSSTIDLRPNQPIQFSLFVRDEGDTVLASLDRGDLEIKFDPPQDFSWELGPRGSYMTIIPESRWQGSQLSVKVGGSYKSGLRRLGLFFFGGRRNNLIEQQFGINIDDGDTGEYELAIPGEIGDPSSIFEITRLSCPYPTMLPSYNQIGFDSLHYLAGVVEGTNEHALLWVVQARWDGQSGQTLPAADLGDCFFLELENSGGTMTFGNYDYVELRFMGAWDMPFHLFRLAGGAGELSDGGASDFAFSCIARGNDIEFYGRFLKLAGLSDRKTGFIDVSGAARIISKGTGTLPSDLQLDTVFMRTDNGVRAEITDGRIQAGEHLVRLFLVDENSGAPIAVNYARETVTETDSSGNVSAVAVSAERGFLERDLRAYLMVDTFPAARSVLLFGD